MLVAPPFSHQMAMIAPSTPTPTRPPENDWDETIFKMHLWEFGREISMILPEKSRRASFCLGSDKYFYTMTSYLTICSVQRISERYRDVTAITARCIAQGGHMLQHHVHHAQAKHHSGGPASTVPTTSQCAVTAQLSEPQRPLPHSSCTNSLSCSLSLIRK